MLDRLDLLPLLLWVAFRLVLCQTEACRRICLPAFRHRPLVAFAVPAAPPVDPAASSHHLPRPAVPEGGSEEGRHPSDRVADADPWDQMAAQGPTRETDHGSPTAELVRKTTKPPLPCLALTVTGRRPEASTASIPDSWMNWKSFPLTWSRTWVASLAATSDWESPEMDQHKGLTLKPWT